MKVSNYFHVKDLALGMAVLVRWSITWVQTEMSNTGWVAMTFGENIY